MLYRSLRLMTARFCCNQLDYCAIPKPKTYDSTYRRRKKEEENGKKTRRRHGVLRRLKPTKCPLPPCLTTPSLTHSTLVLFRKFNTASAYLLGQRVPYCREAGPGSCLSCPVPEPPPTLPQFRILPLRSYPCCRRSSLPPPQDLDLPSPCGASFKKMSSVLPALAAPQTYI